MRLWASLKKFFIRDADGKSGTSRKENDLFEDRRQYSAENSGEVLLRRTAAVLLTIVLLVALGIIAHPGSSPDQFSWADRTITWLIAGLAGFAFGKNFS
ncbi:MAG TPA: hypothetical protein VGG48_07690 [Rhizomicrobium sp.]|jgi:hypothetical protein